VVLEQVLGLVVQEARNKRLLERGKKMYDGYKVKLFREYGDSQADFVRLVFGQRGAAEHLLRRTYRALMGAAIDPKALQRETDRLHADATAFRAILTGWLTSPEYLAAARRPRAKAEIPFVRGLFWDLLDRPPAYDELRNVRNAFLGLATRRRCVSSSAGSCSTRASW
ncbi:MAG: hypothetical protein ACE5JG_11065, partial [Planctomycetota bacterium]